MVDYLSIFCPFNISNILGAGGRCALDCADILRGCEFSAHLGHLFNNFPEKQARELLDLLGPWRK